MRVNCWSERRAFHVGTVYIYVDTGECVPSHHFEYFLKIPRKQGKYHLWGREIKPIEDIIDHVVLGSDDRWYHEYYEILVHDETLDHEIIE